MFAKSFMERIEIMRTEQVHQRLGAMPFFLCSALYKMGVGICDQQE